MDNRKKLVKFSINRELWNKFLKECYSRGYSASEVIRKMINEL